MQPKVNGLYRELSILREMFARRRKWMEQTERSLSRIFEGFKALGLLGGSVCCGSDVYSLRRKV